MKIEYEDLKIDDIFNIFNDRKYIVVKKLKDFIECDRLPTINHTVGSNKLILFLQDKTHNRYHMNKIGRKTELLTSNPELFV